MAYRTGARFVRDWREFSRALDRNLKVKILVAAEALERRTKPEGRRNGVLGYVGLAVLRALLLRYHNSGNGLCCPTYATLRAHTGLCETSIAQGLARLERVGILEITRRLVRQRIERISPITGLPEAYVGTVQTSNLYAFAMPPAWSAHVPVAPAKPSPFPPRRQLDLLARMAATWKVSPVTSPKPTTGRADKPSHGPQSLASLIKMSGG